MNKEWLENTGRTNWGETDERTRERRKAKEGREGRVKSKQVRSKDRR